MRGVCFRGPGVVAWEEVPDPRIEQPTDAVVGVEIAGLCGSDLHPFFGREQGLDSGTVMGHEFVGRVLDVGTNVGTVRPGDRVYAPFSTSCGQCVTCRSGLTSRCEQGQLFGWISNGAGLHGGQAERVRVPLADGTLKPVPDGLSAEAALLLGDNFSTACYGADLAGIRPEGVTVVIGCGSVGLLGIVAAGLHGARTIVALDPVPERRVRAAALGAIALAPDAEAVHTIRALGDGLGADSVMEFVGLPAAQRLAWDVLRPGGVMAVIGCHATAFAFSPAEAYDKEPHVPHRPMSRTSLHGTVDGAGRARAAAHRARGHAQVCGVGLRAGVRRVRSSTGRLCEGRLDLRRMSHPTVPRPPPRRWSTHRARCRR